MKILGLLFCFILCFHYVSVKRQNVNSLRIIGSYIVVIMAYIVAIMPGKYSPQRCSKYIQSTLQVEISLSTHSGGNILCKGILSHNLYKIDLSIIEYNSYLKNIYFFGYSSWAGGLFAVTPRNAKINTHILFFVFSGCRVKDTQKNKISKK